MAESESLWGVTTESTKAVVGIALSSKSSIDKELKDSKKGHKTRHDSLANTRKRLNLLQQGN